ncbi:MAG: glycoside hydrolase family 20 zincin-like fold domain-containing protein [Candidatus Latescibacterota bacterium]
MSLTALRDRVIPLPKELEADGSVSVPAGRLALDAPTAADPALRTAVSLLAALARCRAEAAPEFVLRLRLTGADGVPPALACRLRGLPHAEQAYAILPDAEGSGLLLVANTGTGALYAARTLEQLLRAPAVPAADSPVEVPLVRVVDWPDLDERGQWGGNSESDLAWTARWKLNLLEASASPGMDARGQVHLGIAPGLLRQGLELGVRVVPFVAHLEGIARSAGVAARPDIVSTPDPSRPLPSDYVPGLCCSSPATEELVAAWLDLAAGLEGVRALCVWLSEGASPCYCPRCRDQEPYDLEVACITRAFARIRPRHPGVQLRLLLTQGSYPVNDRILAAAPPEVGITYYDGGRTYDSSRRPMIYPLLEEHAARGGWLGCYPQITHSWRTVFPWTAPQFIRYRAEEFAHKRLAAVIGYAVPSNRYHEHNVMALAEWTWNAAGRTPEEFARAYAALTGVADPELFARWALLAGEAGWSLAESRLFLGLIYDPSLGVAGPRPLDHRFEQAGLVQPAHLTEMLGVAEQALGLARQAGDAEMVCESECVLAGLQVFAALLEAGHLLAAAAPTLDSPSTTGAAGPALARALDEVDRCAAVVRRSLLAWGDRVGTRSGETRLPTRLLDTAFVLYRTGDALRSLAARTGLPDPRPHLRLAAVGAWQAEDFARAAHPVLRFEVTSRVPAQGGTFQVGVDFADSAYGTQVERACLVDEGQQVLASSPDCPDGVSMWERWAELRLQAPPRRTASRLWLEVQLSGLPEDAPAERRTCAGTVGLRRVEG